MHSTGISRCLIVWDWRMKPKKYSLPDWQQTCRNNYVRCEIYMAPKETVLHYAYQLRMLTSATHHYSLICTAFANFTTTETGIFTWLKAMIRMKLRGSRLTVGRMCHLIGFIMSRLNTCCVTIFTFGLPHPYNSWLYITRCIADECKVMTLE